MAKTPEVKESLDSKQFEGYLILDYRNKGMRVIKTLPKSGKLKPFEIAIKIDIKLNIPKNPEIVAKGEFDIPAVKVREMFLDSV